MKNALLLFSNQSGHGQFAAHEDAIVRGLHRTFDEVDVVFTASAEEGQKRAKEACGEYHSLIIVGGDGTFHNILNAVAEEKDIPIIGYINNGTIGDIGRNFGVTGSYKKALKIIAGQHVMEADVCKTGDRYFAYVAAVGSFATSPTRLRETGSSALAKSPITTWRSSRHSRKANSTRPSMSTASSTKKKCRF
jgi:diacylglycerol kinase family enzyme